MKHPTAKAVFGDTPRQLALGLLFGVIFGFLLQKGGVAKFEVLIGALLLTDFTVMQVMLSAIIVGMAGIFIMNHFGLVKLQLKPTKYGANIIGGLIFGVGFALAAYCPGTGAAALGQGNFDALAVIVGLMAGSYLFALNSAWLEHSVGTWGNRGKISLADLVHQPNWIVAIVLGLVLAGVLALLAFIPTLPPPVI